MEYNFREIEQKWQKRWVDNKTYQVTEKENKPKYYVLNMPTLSDREFDEKMHRLQALEAQYPDMFDPKSPTQHVGSDLDNVQRDDVQSTKEEK